MENPKGIVGDAKEAQFLPEALDDEPLVAMLHRSYREFKALKITENIYNNNNNNI